MRNIRTKNCSFSANSGISHGQKYLVYDLISCNIWTEKRYHRTGAEVSENKNDRWSHHVCPRIFVPVTHTSKVRSRVNASGRFKMRLLSRYSSLRHPRSATSSLNRRNLHALSDRTSRLQRDTWTRQGITGRQVSVFTAGVPPEGGGGVVCQSKYDRLIEESRLIRSRL